eukprot:TRINITY_DN63116_c0_g1_i2.p1 TRINITY_DN63116_c0_g1~~TRINITY_DN63116_c0_g1_i2.p1  ORF type:complete len:566 (-),score=-26.54 TRINITY_DN63116_c0_g1_i2:183-1880(-)
MMMHRPGSSTGVHPPISQFPPSLEHRPSPLEPIGNPFSNDPIRNRRASGKLQPLDVFHHNHTGLGTEAKLGSPNELSPPSPLTATSTTPNSSTRERSPPLHPPDDIRPGKGRFPRPGSGNSLRRASVLTHTPEFTKDHSVRDVYRFGEPLSNGNGGTEVFEGKNKQTGRQVAIKIVNKENISPETLLNLTTNIKIMKKLSHPHIESLIDVYEEENKLFLIFELLRGGTLNERVNKGERFGEAYIKLIFHQILKALRELHHYQIVHQDIRPVNILFAEEDDDEPNIRITAFSTEKLYACSPSTSTFSLHYAAPETLANIYKEQHHSTHSDMWSMGVLLYVMISGEQPFEGVNKSDVMDNIKNISYKFESRVWATASDDVKDLLNHLLADQTSRWTAEKCIQHPWLANLNDVDSEIVDESKDIFRKNSFSRPFSSAGSRPGSAMGSRPTTPHALSLKRDSISIPRGPGVPIPVPSPSNNRERASSVCSGLELSPASPQAPAGRFPGQGQQSPKSANFLKRNSSPNIWAADPAFQPGSHGSHGSGGSPFPTSVGSSPASSFSSSPPPQ